MHPSSNQEEKSRKQSAFNITLVAVVGQVGCLTTLIVLTALFIGIWLDNQFRTQPIFTVGLMIISVPITLVIMIWIVRFTVTKLKINRQSKDSTEE
jgi:F0F1-type ATP synthase assembly protein I